MAAAATTSAAIATATDHRNRSAAGAFGGWQSPLLREAVRPSSSPGRPSGLHPPQGGRRAFILPTVALALFTVFTAVECGLWAGVQPWQPSPEDVVDDAGVGSAYAVWVAGFVARNSELVVDARQAALALALLRGASPLVCGETVAAAERRVAEWMGKWEVSGLALSERARLDAFRPAAYRSDGSACPAIATWPTPPSGAPWTGAPTSSPPWAWWCSPASAFFWSHGSRRAAPCSASQLTPRCSPPVGGSPPALSSPHLRPCVRDERLDHRPRHLTPAAASHFLAEWTRGRASVPIRSRSLLSPLLPPTSSRRH